ncbi:MAG: M28 family peptidase [Saprospiraceae bacterium]
MKINLSLISILLFNNFLFANQIPVLTQCNVTLVNNTLEVQYELSDADNSSLEVQCILYYGDGSKRNEKVLIKSISGDVGFPVLAGPYKKLVITLEDLADLNSNIRVLLSAYDREQLDISELINQVDKSRVYNELALLQGKRNESSDKAFKDKSRQYITDQLNSYGYVKAFQSKVGNFSNINYENSRWGTNDPSSIEIVDAHYDSYGQAPGADDNASGVSGVLEIFRILSPYASKKTIRYILFDLEESGLVGSNLYVNNQVNPNDKINHVINFEMIGYYSDQDNTQELPTGFNLLFPEAYNDVIANNRKGNFITNVGNTASKSLIALFAQAASNYVTNLKVISLEVPGTGTLVPDLRRSDHASFWDKGYQALMITDGANFRNKNYHTPKDSLNYLNMDFLTNVLKTTIVTLINLAEIEHGTSVEISYAGSTYTEQINKNLFTSFQTGNYYKIIAENEGETYTVKFINLNGELLYTNIFSKNCEISLDKIATNGVIFLSLESKNKKQIKKIFVSH